MSILFFAISKYIYKCKRFVLSYYYDIKKEGNNMALGNEVEIAIKERNMTIRDLSDKTGISYNTLYAFIKRDSDTITATNLFKILDVLYPNEDSTNELGSAIDRANELLKVLDYRDKEKHSENFCSTIMNIDEQLSPHCKNIVIEILSKLLNLNELAYDELRKRVDELTQLEKYRK